MSRCGSVSAAALLLLGLAACGDDAGDAAPAPAPSTAAPAEGTPNARADLAARAALAQDKAYAALYTLDDGGAQPRNVVATLGADRTWKVDVGGGALGGTSDVSLVSVPKGLYQCTVAAPTCVRIAEPGKRVPKEYDPRVQRLFRQWLAVFTDREAALAVTEVQPLAGAQGTCFSVDSISASLAAPVDIGIYCYADDGVLTAARVGYGTLKLVNQVDGPPTVPLPGPEVGGQPMGSATPAPPPPVLQPSVSTSPA